jgi:redox-sensitive bicupin YhaK (pirin superfamily)
VLHPGAAVIRAPQPASVVLVGGAPLDGDRHMYWNFVSSSRDKIEAAKSAWREKRMPLVPGDEHERVELPEAHSPPSR